MGVIDVKATILGFSINIKEQKERGKNIFVYNTTNGRRLAFLSLRKFCEEGNFLFWRLKNPFSSLEYLCEVVALVGEAAQGEGEGGLGGPHSHGAQPDHQVQGVFMQGRPRHISMEGKILLIFTDRYNDFI